MDIWQAVILGAIQGITEWLPISSSGHLVIAQQWMNIETPLLFDILLHIGTLLAVFIVFWNEIKCVALSYFVAQYNEYRKMLWYIIIATAATGIIGLTFKGFFESVFNNLLVIGIALIATSILLFSTKKHHETRCMNNADALLIGISQGIAIMPGISRSGTTISLGLLRGLPRQEVARFSFLLSIPAILGALIVKIFDGELSALPLIPTLIGTVISFIIGYISIKWLMKIISHEKFYLFGWYTLILGLIVILIS